MPSKSHPRGDTPPREQDQSGDQPGKAAHGYKNEVSWSTGQGRQPYGNQGPQDSGPPAAGLETEDGDRGIHSGTNREQMDRASGKP